MTGLIGKYGHNYKSLLKLALPIIIGQLGGIITGLADTIMVGQHSTAELAASSFVNNVLNTFIIFGTGFSFALTLDKMYKNKLKPGDLDGFNSAEIRQMETLAEMRRQEIRDMYNAALTLM